MLMCRPHVVGANLSSAGPAARCSAYRLSPAFSRSRESNSPTPCSARNSAHSRTVRAYDSHVPGECAPLAGSSRSHWFTATAGRGSPGPSSSIRSSSIRTGIRSGISGRCSASQDSQPCDEKKFRITSRNHRNTTRPAAAGNHSSNGASELIATRQLSRENAAELGGGQLPGCLAVAVAGDERLTAGWCQQVVDVGGEAVEAGQHVGVHPVVADAGVGEQVGGVVVDGEQHADGLVDDVQDDPFFGVPGEPAVFEDPAAQLVADAAVRAGLGERAIAGELADYWWRGVIRSMHYS